MEKINLGADNSAIVISRLKEFLESPHKREFTGELEGVNVCWLASLSEKHFSIYGGVKDSQIHLFFQSPENVVVSHIVLTDKERENCLIILNNAAT